VVIRTARLILRDFLESDWQAVHAYQNDPRYLKFYTWEGRSPQEVQQFIGRFIGWQAEVPRRCFQLAITLPGDNRLVGNCGIRKNQALAQDAEMGFELAPEHWGKGYATEAALAMLNFAFTTLKLKRVYASCLAENHASAHVLGKIGMRLERIEPEGALFKNRSWDVLHYSISIQAA
jgi:RimJ/RimL family protein N-acetyltransferase